jgi:hypothetical protein
MSVIPLHLQRRFEQRWAARFGSLVIPAGAKNVGLKGSPVNTRRARQMRLDTSASLFPNVEMWVTSLRDFSVAVQ